MMKLPILWTFGLLLLLIGCLSTAPKSGEAVRNESASTGALQLQEANNDLERLAALWEVRQKDRHDNDYPVGPGDVIEINVAGMEEIKNYSERVTREGTITLPFVGVIDSKGMTDKMLREEIRRRLQTNYMHNPQVSLFVKEFRSRQVAVIGAVQKPGLYNLVTSGDTLLGLISQAGGMTAGSSERILFIPAETAEPDAAKKIVSTMPVHLVSQDPSPLILKDVEPIVINLAAINRGGNQIYLSMPARPGDVIMVPGAGEVLIQGWVAKPGSYKISSGLTLLGLVAAAGGAMFAGDSSAVKLMRTNKLGQRTIHMVDLEAIASGQEPDVLLREGDLVDVTSSGPKAVAYGVYRFFTTFMRVGANASIPIAR